MHIRDIGVSALKGGRHALRGRVTLGVNGPAGDREFAAVDLTAGCVLKTVEHPSLMACDAEWADGLLSLHISGRRITAKPQTDAHSHTLDYWGRAVSMRVVTGPWSDALSRLLRRRVHLARIVAPGGVVFGDSVTIVTTSSLDQLARESGQRVDTRRFRSTFTIDTKDAAAHGEDSWAGREIDVGGARLRVGSGIPRCAVIDSHPDTGARGTKLLKTLAGYRGNGGEITFGVYAQVLRPGVITLGDGVLFSKNTLANAVGSRSRTG